MKLKHIGYRIYQKVMYVGMGLMPWRAPKILSSLQDIKKLLADNNKTRPIIVCDLNTPLKSHIDFLVSDLASKNIEAVIFDEVLPNPSIDVIEKGVSVYNSSKCDCLIAIGGGSSLDCAKVIGARVVKPKKTVQKMKGLLKVRKKLPLFIAVPTTAGTGSEVTVAAVVTDKETHQKYPINDFSLIPHYAVLDATLTVSLPKSLTATTGIDALTHAVEAYIGKSNTKKTKQQAEKAVALIFNNLKKAYDTPDDITARHNMQVAAYLAGQAFTRAYVGYVHALAHALGGFYGVPHGLANSILLSPVLYAFGEPAYKKLAKLADVIGVCKEGTTEEKALAFIGEIQTLCAELDIPTTIPSKYEITQDSLPKMAEHALAESNPLYPVPRIMDKEDFVALYQEVI